MYTDGNNPSLLNKEETKWRGTVHLRMVTHPEFKLVRDERTQNQYNTLLSNMEVDIEAQNNFTDKLPNILTAMTQHDSRIVHCTAFVRQMTTVQDYM